MMRRRGLRLGVEDADGLIPIAGRLALMPGLLLKELLQAHERAGADVSFASSTGESAHAADERTREQRRHDAFAAIVTAAARAADAPTVGGAAPSVLVTVAADDLDDPEGRIGDPIGRLDGSSTPLSRGEVERLIDAGGLQPVVLTPAGATVGIGSSQRCFTAAQRRALIARDGGCVIPGCRIPAAWCEAHHVIPWRDGGPTTTGNGVLLCWWHHSRIDTGPWAIRMTDGIPHVRGPGHPGWTPRRPPEHPRARHGPARPRAA